jgi:hypothetical protein
LTHDPPLGNKLVESRYHCLSLDAQGAGQGSRSRQTIGGAQAATLNVRGYGADDLLKQRNVVSFEREIHFPSSHDYFVLPLV